MVNVCDEIDVIILVEYNKSKPFIDFIIQKILDDVPIGSNVLNTHIGGYTLMGQFSETYVEINENSKSERPFEIICEDYIIKMALSYYGEQNTPTFAPLQIEGPDPEEFFISLMLAL